MPNEPTPDEIRRRLAELLGWQVDPPAFRGRGVVLDPDGNSFHVDSLPDPATDLNAMAAVEAAMRERGLLDGYLNQLRSSPLGDQWPMDDWSSNDIRAAVIAPASARALAAYRVLTAPACPADAPPCP